MSLEELVGFLEAQNEQLRKRVERLEQALTALHNHPSDFAAAVDHSKQMLMVHS